MSTSDTGLVGRFRQPEYTGENRCTPCTIVNTGIAIIVAAAVGAGLAAGTAASAVAAGGIAVVLFAVFAATIYLRGYLVPGTPTLTKRYFPDWLLAKFDKLPEDHPDAGATAAETDAATETTTNPDDVPVEDHLLAAAAAEPCEDVDDLCLTAAFERAWQQEVDALGEETDRERIATVLGVEGDAEIREHGDAFVLLVDDRRAGQWESEAALLSDLAAANVLEQQYDEWAALDSIERGQVVGGLRIFVETCPVCGGPVSLSQDTVESCCRSYEVVAAGCEDCDDRLLEVGM